MKRIIWPVIWIFLAVNAVGQIRQRIISYGADLTPAEKQTVSQEFPIPINVKLAEIKTLTTSNEEEWKLLKGLVPDAEIGAKAVSSVYIEKLPTDAGLKVETKNLSLVTPHMVANALTTAGVKDVKVAVIAPVLVSGTAVLTGVYKSFEELTGTKLKAEARRTAAEELIKTGSLGEDLGKERAATLIDSCKERIFQENAADRTAINTILERIARDQGLSLSDTQKQDISGLLFRIKQLNLNPEQLRIQMKNFHKTSAENLPPQQPQSLLARLIAFIKSLMDQLFSFVGRIIRTGGR